MRIIVHVNVRASLENYDNVVMHGRVSLVPSTQERNEAQPLQVQLQVLTTPDPEWGVKTPRKETAESYINMENSMHRRLSESSSPLTVT